MVSQVPPARLRVATEVAVCGRRPRVCGGDPAMAYGDKSYRVEQLCTFNTLAQ